MIRSSFGGKSGLSRTGGYGARFRIASNMTRGTLAAKGQRRWPSRTALPQKKTDRCARPIPSPAPAPATCRPLCRAWYPGLVRCSSATVDASDIRAATLAGRTSLERDLRQPEVENLGVAALGHKDVCGLDVAMNDALGVGRIERVRNLDARASSVSISMAWPRSCFSVTPSRNSMAMNDWPSCFADLVDGADVGMVQCGAARASRRKRSRA